MRFTNATNEVKGAAVGFQENGGTLTDFLHTKKTEAILLVNLPLLLGVGLGHGV